MYLNEDKFMVVEFQEGLYSGLKFKFPTKPKEFVEVNGVRYAEFMYDILSEHEDTLILRKYIQTFMLDFFKELERE